MRKKIRLSTVDVVLILFCIAAISYVVIRFDSVFTTEVNMVGMGQYFFRRHSVTGEWGANILVTGIIATIKISIWAMIPASIVGVLMGIFRTSGNLFLRMVGRSYVELVRNLPPLVLIYIFYFFVADQFAALLGLDEFVRGLSEGGQGVIGFFFAETKLFVQFLAGIFTLAFFTGAYITEIVRAGIESVETGQRQAAYSLGLSWWDEMRYIILPQAIKVVIPALASQYIDVIKYSSIMSVVSIQETTYMAQQVILLNSDMFATWTTIAAIYLVLTFGLSLVAGRVEVRMARSG